MIYLPCFWNNYYHPNTCCLLYGLVQIQCQFNKTYRFLLEMNHKVKRVWQWQWSGKALGNVMASGILSEWLTKIDPWIVTLIMCRRMKTQVHASPVADRQALCPIVSTLIREEENCQKAPCVCILRQTGLSSCAIVKDFTCCSLTVTCDNCC